MKNIKIKGLKIMKKTIKIGILTTLSLIFAFSLMFFVSSAKNVKAKEIPVKESLVEGTFEMIDGVSLKLNEDGGIRFKAKMDETVNVFVSDSNVELGFIIAPKQLLQNETNYFAMDKNLKIVADKSKIYFDGEYYYANGCITKILPENRELDFVAIAYLLKENKVQYTEYKDTARGNLYDVVNQAILDEYTEDVFSLNSYNAWYGTNDFPILVNDTESYDKLIDIVNESDILKDKKVIVSEGVNHSEGKTITNQDNAPIIKKEYTVTFNAANGSEVTTKTVVDGELVEKPEIDPNKSGYTFTAWMNGETAWNFETDTVTADVTLVANYVANTDTEYTVDLIVTKRDGNTESFGTVTFKGTTDEEIDVDSAIASLQNAVPATTLDETATRTALAEKTILGDGSLKVNAYFNVAKVTLVEDGYTVGGLGLAFSDCYQNTYEVVRTEEVKYGTEEASVKLAFQKDRKYCNFVVDLPQGESTTMLEFHLYNKTGKALEIFTNPSQWSSVTAVSAEEGWQLIQLYADPTATFVNVYLRSAGEAEPVNTENNTSAVYLSVVNPAVEKQGTYLDFTTAQGVSEARFKTWIGATAESSADKKYNDQNTLKVALNSTAYGAGFYLEAKTWDYAGWHHDYAQTLKYFLNMANVKSVTLSFMYNASEVTGNATNYIGIGVGANDGIVMDKTDTWNRYEVTITEVWENPILYVALTNGCGWASGSFSVGGNLYVTNIEYELHYVDEVEPIKVVASTTQWQDPASVVSSTEFVYGTETTSVKVTTQAGYKYASLVLQNTSSATDYCVQFYILNKTGKDLDIYTDYSKFSGVKTYVASDEWQLVTLWCDPTADTIVNIRGAGETVINGASVAFYISEVKPAQQPA